MDSDYSYSVIIDMDKDLISGGYSFAQTTTTDGEDSLIDIYRSTFNIFIPVESTPLEPDDEDEDGAGVINLTATLLIFGDKFEKKNRFIMIEDKLYNLYARNNIVLNNFESRIEISPQVYDISGMNSEMKYNNFINLIFNFKIG